jgi:hypothetical protein
VRDRIVADATLWIPPLTVVLEEFHRAVVLATDSNTAQVWELFQGQIEQLQAVRDRSPASEQIRRLARSQGTHRCQQGGGTRKAQGAGPVPTRGEWAGSCHRLRDELVEQVIDEGGSIEHVEVDTKAGTPPGRSSPAVPVAPVPSIR